MLLRTQGASSANTDYDQDLILFMVCSRISSAIRYKHLHLIVQTRRPAFLVVWVFLFPLTQPTLYDQLLEPRGGEPPGDPIYPQTICNRRLRYPCSCRYGVHCFVGLRVISHAYHDCHIICTLDDPFADPLTVPTATPIARKERRRSLQSCCCSCTACWRLYTL